MKPKRKRRWLLGIVAVGAGVAVAGFIIFREDPKDVPRLVVLRQEQANGGKRVVFRFDAPEHRNAFLTSMWTVNPSTGKESRPLGVCGDTRYEILDVQTPLGKQFILNPALEAEAGQSTEFSVLPPPDAVWRLRCQVMVEEKGISSVLWRMKVCWERKSLALLRDVLLTPLCLLDSELVTNAVPATTETPAR